VYGDQPGLISDAPSEPQRVQRERGSLLLITESSENQDWDGRAVAAQRHVAIDKQVNHAERPRVANRRGRTGALLGLSASVLQLAWVMISAHVVVRRGM
jgi:hypothetical protein